MGLFGKKQRGYLGIDLGTSSVKIVQLDDLDGRPKLVTYGFSETPASIVKTDDPALHARLAEVVKQIIAESHATATHVVAALPSYAVFSSVISLPAMSEKELVSAVRWEAKKFVPMPLDEMTLDWKVLNIPGVKGAEGRHGLDVMRGKAGQGDQRQKVKNLEILLTAAPKNIVRRYLSLFKMTGLQLMSLETEAFALERSLIGNDRAAILLVDVGALSTDISVIVDRVPVLNRSIDVGGDTITRTIAKNFNISIDRAEQFKRDFGIAASQGNQVPKTIEFVVGSVINEIKHVFSLYASQGGTPIEKVVLAGGSSFLPQLPEFLSSTLNIKVFIGDPWARVIYPEELTPALKEIGPRFAVSVGLALRHLVP
ncbi:MAG: pilus assembly protein PilM [Candidatus Kerfeldbacteria bacterium]|nr:pilus assembly protein PilM [Candidatus Kerfeldbacteria bacterium]